MRMVRKFLPFVVSALLLLVLAGYAPWHEVIELLSQARLLSIIGLLLLSILYYSLKTLRFWYLLQAIGIHEKLSIVSLSYMSAQPVSLLPAGEVFRSHSLRRYTGIPVKKSIAQFTMQGFLEGASMAILLVVSALALHVLRIPALILIAVILMAVIGIQKGYLNTFFKGLNKLPFINASQQSVTKFNDQQKAVLSKQWLPLLIGLSLAIELCGVAIAYISVIEVGQQVNFFQAALLYVVPVIVGFITFLPGGFGASEQSAVALLLLAGIAIAPAVAATLIMRVTIVGLGFVYGVCAFTYGRLRYQPHS